MKHPGIRIPLLVVVLLVALCRVQPASAQARFPRDTITPHFARWNDELPGLLSSITSVFQFGFDSTDRAWLLGEIATRRLRHPLGRYESSPSMTYVFPTGFRGREVPLSLFVYWRDTSTVAIRVRSPDRELEDTIASVLFDARMATLASPRIVRMSIAEPDPYNGFEPGIVFTISVPNAPHCPGFDSERRMRWQGDTLLVQMLGVAAPGFCPSAFGLRGPSVIFYKPPGRYVIAADSRGDTNVVTLIVTDTSFALVPVRTTYVNAEQTVKWRYPSASVTLRCSREAGDPHFCDALHEFIEAQPGVRPFTFPTGGVNPLGSGFGMERRMTYRYADEGTAAKVRRCVASFPPQTRLDSWVRLFGRPSVGRWWAESPTGGSNSSTERRAPAEGLDASGNVPAHCGDVGTFAHGGSRTMTRRAVRTTRVSTFAFGQTNPTTISARSDGWIVLAPLRSWMGAPDSTTHLYARAAEAQRWVQRVRDVLSGRSISRENNEADRFIQRLGRGAVRVETRVTDSVGYPKVSFAFQECRVQRPYNVDGAALLTIAARVEQAAGIALRGSSVPISPTLEHAYEVTDVSCPAVALDDSTRNRIAALQRAASGIRAKFVVDTAGRVEQRSITFGRGTTRAFAAAARADIARWRYQPAEWAGIRVRQIVHLVER